MHQLHPLSPLADVLLYCTLGIAMILLHCMVPPRPPPIRPGLMLLFYVIISWKYVINLFNIALVYQDII